MSYFSGEKYGGRRQPSKWQRMLPLVAGIVLIGFFGSIFWSSSSYSNSAIVDEFFMETSVDQQEIKSDLLPTDPIYLENQVLAGELLMKSQQYFKAYEVYDSVLQNAMSIPSADNKKDLLQTVEWNRILSILARGEREITMEALDHFIEQTPTVALKEKGIALKNKLNSFWYGWAN